MNRNPVFPCRRLDALLSPTREYLVGDTGKPGYRIEIEEENRI